MWLFNLLFSSLSQLWYVEVRISRSVSVSPLEFEITRVDCTFLLDVAHISVLTLVMLIKLRCHSHFQFSANQITWCRLLIQIHILNGKLCRSRSVGFFRSQLIWICTVCKGMAYTGSARQGLKLKAHIIMDFHFLFSFLSSKTHVASTMYEEF